VAEDGSNANDLSRDIGAIEFISSAVDAESPTAPAGLEAAAISAVQVDLSWFAATDNTGVAGYRIYRDGEQIGTATDTAFSDTGCQSATSYTYTVKAFDAAGNLGPASNEATVATARQTSGTDTGGDGGGSSGSCFLSALK
jgi:chitodextrinase